MAGHASIQLVNFHWGILEFIRLPMWGLIGFQLCFLDRKLTCHFFLDQKPGMCFCAKSTFTAEITISSRLTYAYTLTKKSWTKFSNSIQSLNPTTKKMS
jgi:hypothetical protein